MERDYKVGQKIRIIYLNDPSAEYNGKTGIIERVSVDPFGDVRLSGTWGSVAVYPYADKIEIVEDGGKNA